VSLFEIETTSKFDKATLTYVIDKSKLGDTEFDNLLFLAANKRIKELEKKNRELEELNEFLEETSAFFAANRRKSGKKNGLSSFSKRLMTVGSQEGSVFTARLWRLQDKHFTIISAIKTPPGSIRCLQMK